jgi:hypothetical protein
MSTKLLILIIIIIIIWKGDSDSMNPTAGTATPNATKLLNCL